MKEELIKYLKPITEEEQKFLNGDTSIDRDLYMDDMSNVIRCSRLLAKGKLITVRPHTRFVHFPKHKHDYIEVVYMCSGSTTHIIGGHELILSEGELLFLGQNATQEILPAGENDIAVNFIILPEFFSTTLDMLGTENSPLKTFLIDCLRNPGNASAYLHFKVSDILPVQNLVENMIWVLLNGAYYKRDINQITMGLLFMHLLSCTEHLSYDIPEKGTVIRVLDYIEQNYKNPSLTHLAEQMNCSIHWLSREIKSQTGKTYTELLQEKRLAQASYFLKRTEMSIADIADAVGYDNLSYFYRIFQAAYGTTPKHFRDCK